MARKVANKVRKSSNTVRKSSRTITVKKSIRKARRPSVYKPKEDKSTKKKSHYKQGKFIPKNPEKYMGDIKNITYRSGWELKVMAYFDNRKDVLHWGSEIIIVPYIKPTDGKQHRYYTDFYIEYKGKNDKIIKEVIEVKPYSQTRPPRKNSKTKNVLTENLTYAINIAKWEAATKWCKQRGINFRILTEKEIFK